MREVHKAIIEQAVALAKKLDVVPKDNAWGSGPFGQNESRSNVITKDENYFCNLHKVMKGTIKIE